MTTTLLLIRHGAHDRLGRVLCGRMPGVTLNLEGMRQAEALAQALRDQDVAAVYSGPLERARQTAEPIAAVTSAGAVAVDPDLDEIDLGAWSGQDFAALQDDPAWESWNLRRDLTRPPGGEAMIEVQARVARRIERLATAFPGARLALVSHADVIKAALAWGLGLPLAQLARFEVAPASISRLVVGAWGAKVWSINQTPGAPAT